MSTITLRSYVESDRSSVRAFLGRAIGSTTNFDRYETNNPLGRPIRVIAEQDGQVVGYNQWNAWLVYAGDGPVVVYQSGTSAVGPECRGQRVFARLLAEGTRDAEHLGVTAFIGFPNPLSKGSLMRDGWVHIKDLLLYTSLMPALGRRVSPPMLSEFSSWRYRDASMMKSRVDERTVVFVAEHRRNIKTIRILDVLRDDGTRDYSKLPTIIRALPGPAVAYFRCSAPPPKLMLHIPRKWDTPVLVKRITADQATLGRIHDAAYAYGDIDAA